MQPGGSGNGRALVDEDRPDVTVELAVDGFGVIAAEIDWFELVELLARGKVKCVFDGKEEDPESVGEVPVWSGVMGGCDLDEGDDGSVTDET